jgi:hypothetical protein
MLFDKSKDKRMSVEQGTRQAPSFNAGIGEWIIKSLALIVPWGFVETCFSSAGRPKVGYVVGLTVGLLSFYLVSAGKPRLWKLVLMGAAVSVCHFGLKII